MGIISFFTLLTLISYHFAEDAEAVAIPEFDDPNIDKEAAIAGVLGMFFILFGFVGSSVSVVSEDDSPYPEVRSAVANTDDPSIPVDSVRSWVIGLIWAIIIPGLNQFFFFRYPCKYYFLFVSRLVLIGILSTQPSLLVE